MSNIQIDFQDLEPENKKNKTEVVKTSTGF